MQLFNFQNLVKFFIKVLVVQIDNVANNIMRFIRIVRIFF